MKRLIILILIALISQMCKISKPYTGSFISRQGVDLWSIEKELHGKELLIIEDYISTENGISLFSGLVCKELGGMVSDSSSKDGVAFVPGIAGIDIYQVIKIDKKTIQGKFLSTTDCNGHFVLELKGTEGVGLIFSYPTLGEGSRYYEFNPNKRIDDRDRLKLKFKDC